MDDGKTAPPAAKRRRKESPHVPQEIVSEILVNLPVESLMRFSCVCKAWQSTVCRDASFHRAHLRHQKPCLLVSPHTLHDGHRPMDKVGLYRWEANQQCTTVPLMHDIDLTSDYLMHDFVHCDGLVLLPVRFTAYVLNPATRRTLKLPRGRGADSPRRKPLICDMCYQAFGLGHDPRSGAYKVARISYPSLLVFTGTCSYHSITMEVFTIGTDRHWRETVTPPPYPVLACRTATFFKGSLIWAIDERNLGKAAPGFLRFSLEDEAFGVMPPPPCYPRLEEYTQFSLSELRGELCLACEGANINSVELWMCNSVEKPRWDRRYTIPVLMFSPPELCPIAIFDEEIVFKERVSYTGRYNLKTKAYKDRFSMVNLRYHHPSTGKLGYQRKIFFSFDVIPYVPSLIPV